MSLDRSELNSLTAPTRGGFGKSSPDRTAIINAMADGNLYTLKEIKEASGVEKASLRLGVMKRDKLITVGDKDGIRYYALTDKGIARSK